MEAWPKKEGARRERGWSMPRVHWWGCRQWFGGSRSRARAPCFSSGRKTRGAGRRRSRRRGLCETVTRAVHTARTLARKPCVVPAADWGPGGQSMLDGIGTRCTVERAHGASSSCPGCTCGATLVRARTVHVPPYASLECAFHRGARRTVQRRTYPKRKLRGVRYTFQTRNAQRWDVQCGPFARAVLTT